MSHPSTSDPLRQAAESLGRFLGRRRGRILYALGLHDGGSVTLTVFDRDGAASAELSAPMVEQLIAQLRSRQPEVIISPSSSDRMRQAAESVEQLKRGAIGALRARAAEE